MSENGGVITTLVTTELFHEIARSFGLASFEVLTGFKYIAEKIEQWEQSGAHTFIFGAEESLGFLYGTHARDKDATSAACLIAEMALQQKKKGETLLDLLEEIFDHYGPFSEKQLSISLKPGFEGMEMMEKVMNALRSSPPKMILNQRVKELLDYENEIEGLPKSNVLLLRLEDQSKLVIRPSGTEPKIKLYGLMRYRDQRRLDATLNFMKDFLLRL